jgi:hypothetical protein
VRKGEDSTVASASLIAQVEGRRKESVEKASFRPFLRKEAFSVQKLLHGALMMTEQKMHFPF